MGSQIDLLGKVFNKLTVIRKAGKNKRNYILWECRCECGNIVVRTSSHIISGAAKSCGCAARLSIGIGARFNRLVVLELDTPYKGHTMYKCRCDCGTVKSIRASALLKDNTLSCGCYNIELITKLGKSSKIEGVRDENNKTTTEYHSYAHMKGRCYTKTNKKYKNYGARGIIVCDRWLNSFENFLADMGKKPSPDLSIERVDVNGNYELSNCIWGTEEEQASNKTNSVHLYYNGTRYTQASFSRLCKVTPHAVEYWLNKGLSAEEIFNKYKNKKC